MMMAPAIFPRTFSRAIMNWPMALADAPRDTNTIENPRMKASEERITRRRARGGRDRNAGAARTRAAHLVEGHPRDIREIAGTSGARRGK